MFTLGIVFILIIVLISITLMIANITSKNKIKVLGLILYLATVVALIGLLRYSANEYERGVYGYAEGKVVIDTLSATTDMKTGKVQYETQLVEVVN